MRVNLGFLGFTFAVGTAVIGFTACGSSVSEVTGGTGGAAGTGGAQSTTTTTTVTSSSGTTTSTTSSSTSSSSGGDNCQMACSHIQMCTGFDACAQGFSFDCTNPQYECAAKCINALSCGDLTLQSGQACLQQCAPQDGGPPPDAGDPCMNACAHVQQCFGIDVCAQLGMQLDCSTPQNACIANCVNGTPCSQLSQQTFQTCQTMCQGTATDGGTAMACQQCSATSCSGQIQACFGDTACQGWLNCVGACQPAMGSQCYTACDNQYPSAAALYGAVYTCSCASCATECAAGDPCAHAP